MDNNVGKTDKTARIVVTIILVIIAYSAQIWWLYLVALVPLITGLINFCPLYTLFKINTNKKK